MSNWYKIFTTLHLLVYKLSGGRIGNKLGKQSVLLLMTKGRKSGQRHTTTLSYYRDGENYLVVGSNWGKESHPDWYLNLRQNPHTSIQVDQKIIEVHAHPAEEQEYQRLWQRVTKQNEQYIQYQKGMQRRIPIVILTPENGE